MEKGLTGKDYLKKALKYYMEDQGASRMSSYRDAVTDILHLAFEDKDMRKEWLKPDKGIKDNLNWDATLKDQMMWNAYSGFEEEREQAESFFLHDIKAENLPLYVNHEWEFVADEYEKRLKDAELK